MHVDVRGLSALAGCCSDQARVVGATGFALTDVAEFASSGAAVAAMHDAVSSVSQKIALQLDSTAAEFREAARGFESNDADNALSLRRPDPPPPGSADV
jgi:hypothetical protein